MNSTMRLGVRRPARPSGIAAPTLAAAEARVIETECVRRLGHVLLDLRVDGDAIGPWQPMALAAWPGDVDHVVVADELWDGSLPALTTLFARTVEPDAADVRRRMLHHLGVLPLEQLDDAVLDGWPSGTLRPTDLWLLATSAARVSATDPAVLAFAAEPAGDAAGALDAAFDRLAAQLLAAHPPESAQRRVQRAHDDARAARAEVAAQRDELRRSERESADLLDELRARLTVVDERAERDDLRRAMTSDEP